MQGETRLTSGSEASSASAQSTGRRFPEGFEFGTATAAYQIEGAWNADGKGPSIWDAFSHARGNVQNGDTGDVACDHYNRWEDDVALMKELGITNYRLSLSWPRIQPDGKGEVNEAGLAFYDRLIDGLLAAGIEPLVTLYHWDLPLALDKAYGGFLSPKVAEHFEQYARICFERFGDRVKTWLTFNEPWCICALGYCMGVHAPGRTQSAGREPYLAAHHLLLAHARMVAAYRADFQAQQGGRIGITLNTDWWEPISSHPRDVAASNRAMAFNLGWFADPIFKSGDYPEEMREACGSRLPRFTREQSASLLGSSDFFGLNHYSTHMCGRPSMCGSAKALPGQMAMLLKSSGSLGRAAAAMMGHCGASYVHDTAVLSYPDLKEWKHTDMDWAIVPWGIRKTLLYIQNRYEPKGGIMITENGCAIKETGVKEAADPNSPAAKQRVQFLHGYVSEVLEAIDQGADVRSYFCWSFMDNFEWALGYSKRFGIVHVDYDTQKRTPRPAAYWLSRLIATRTIPAPEDCLPLKAAPGPEPAAEVQADEQADEQGEEV